MTAAPTAPTGGLSAPDRQVELSVAGMTCAACVSRVERSLNQVDGVSATVSLASERASVSAPAGVPAEQLVEAVRASGYDAAVLEPDGGSAEADAAEQRRRVHRLGVRAALAGVLFMPVCDLSIAGSLGPSLRFDGWQWVLVGLTAPVVLWAAWPIHAGALRALRHGTATMDTTVSLGIVAATVWSLVAVFHHDGGPGGVQHSPAWLFVHHPAGAIYLDVAAGVTAFVLAGRYVEARARLRASRAMRVLGAQRVRTVRLVDIDGSERMAPTAELEVAMAFVVRAGEIVAGDGTVRAGRAALDTSTMTGEPTPASVGPGQAVVAGTVVTDGWLEVEAVAVGDQTQLAGMVRLVEAAQSAKTAMQRRADRWSTRFVPAVLAVSAATLAGWLAARAGADQAFSCALAVLIVACPCAMGLATPTALMVAAGRAAGLGIFLRGVAPIETAETVDTVVFDKTGTVTTGRLAVAEVQALGGWTAADVVRLAGAAEQHSAHGVARALVAEAGAGPGGPAAVQFESVAGLGVRAEVEDRSVVVGRPDLLAELGVGGLEAARAAVGTLEAAGRTAVVVAVDGAAAGVVGLSDTVKASAPTAVARLQRQGLACVLATGDNEGAARAVAEAAGFDAYEAGLRPGDKADLVARLRAAGHVVAVVGDGSNDGPALAAADLGMALGGGTDLAVGAADVVLLRDDLGVVADAVSLTRRTLRTMRTNLWWALAYNVAAIPLAAAGLLNPLIAGAAMALSSIFVVTNSARLQRFVPPRFAVGAPGPPAGGGGGAGLAAEARDEPGTPARAPALS